LSRSCHDYQPASLGATIPQVVKACPDKEVAMTYRRLARVLIAMVLALSATQAHATLTSPALTSPPEGAVIDNGGVTVGPSCIWDTLCNDMTWAFSWSAVAGANRYEVVAIHTGASFAAIDAEVTTTSYTQSAQSYVTDPNRFDWTWRVRAGVSSTSGTQWGPWSADRAFTVEPLNTDCPMLHVELGHSPPSSCAGSNINVYANCLTRLPDRGSSIYTYTWSFDDGGTATGEAVSHQFVTSGNHLVTLNVTDDTGLTGSATDIVTVTPNPIHAAFGYSQTSAGASVVAFIDQSSGSPTAWFWDFGDGTQSQEQNPTHTFPAGCAQDFQVYLSAGSTNWSCQDYIVHTVTVSPDQATCPRPKALVISGTDGVDPTTQAAIEDLSNTARRTLEKEGWEVIHMHGPTPTTITATLADPCVRGIHIVSHGQVLNGNRVVLVQDNAAVSPGYLAQSTHGRPFRFVTVVACMQDKKDWSNAFSVPSGNVHMARFPSHGLARINVERMVAYWTHYGIDASPCPGSSTPSAHDIYAPRTIAQTATPTDCPGLLFCDVKDGRTVCGNALFPVVACGATAGVGTSGQLVTTAPNGLFTVRAHVPPHPDSLELTASAFEAVPESVLVKELNPAHRFLWIDFVDASGLAADSFSVHMSYDPLALGGSNPSLMRVLFLKASDGAFVEIPAIINPITQDIAFTLPEPGMVGLYQSGVAGVPPGPLGGGGQKLSASPNPFRTVTTIHLAHRAGESANIEILDSAGRLVRLLHAGSARATAWDGTDDSGRPVRAGVYFVRGRIVGAPTPTGRTAVVLIR